MRVVVGGPRDLTEQRAGPLRRAGGRRDYTRSHESNRSMAPPSTANSD